MKNAEQISERIELHIRVVDRLQCIQDKELQGNMLQWRGHYLDFLDREIKLHKAVISELQWVIEQMNDPES